VIYIIGQNKCCLIKLNTIHSLSRFAFLSFFAFFSFFSFFIFSLLYSFSGLSSFNSGSFYSGIGRFASSEVLFFLFFLDFFSDLSLTSASAFFDSLLLASLFFSFASSFSFYFSSRFFNFYAFFF